MALHIFEERSARILASRSEVATKDVPVFFNPVMAHNRDTSILVLFALERGGMRVADPLAGSGVRSLRLLKELPRSMVKEVVCNDIRDDFVSLMEKNTKASGLDDKRLRVQNLPFHVLLAKEKMFDYIEIDPFGSPNPFLDLAIQKLRRDGVLAVTATDTSALCGAYPKACLRKYWADPLHDELMQEAGVRILVRKVQLVGVQHEKALTPIFSMAKDHYHRVFFVCKESRGVCDGILKQHGLLREKGPMWLGALWDTDLVASMLRMLEATLMEEDKGLRKFLETVKEESSILTPGFYDIHAHAEKLKCPTLPKTDRLIEAVRNKGFRCARTHFSKQGLRTDASDTVMDRLLKK